MPPPSVAAKQMISNPDWEAVLHILQSPCLQRVRVSRFIDLKSGSFDTRSMLESSRLWSPAQQAMARIAVDLFNGSVTTPIRWLLLYVNDEDFEHVIHALQVWRTARARRQVG